MHVPIKVDYAVRALVDLAQHVDSGPERAAALAQRQGIPEAYLERLLSTLNKQGLVSSQRGPQGGHVLGRNAADIDLRSVMEALGDTVSTVSCIDDPGCCSHSGACGQRDIWRDVEDAVNEILARTSIADLAERTPVIDSATAPAGSASPQAAPVKLLI